MIFEMDHKRNLPGKEVERRAFLGTTYYIIKDKSVQTY